MNNALYLPINNYSRIGEMGISRACVSSIANRCVERAGAAIVRKKQAINPLFSVERGARVSLSKEGVATISVDVSLPKSSPVADICTRIQKEIVSTLTEMLDTLPVEVKVKVVKVY